MIPTLFHHHRSAASWPIAIKQERQGHHQDGGKGKHVIDIDISQSLCLRLKLVVQLPLRQVQSICFSGRHVQVCRNASICC